MCERKLCKKCDREHCLEEVCCYDEFYQKWLLAELARVNFAIYSRVRLYDPSLNGKYAI